MSDEPIPPTQPTQPQSTTLPTGLVVREGEVHADGGSGARTPAMVLTCQQCGGTIFVIFWIDAGTPIAGGLGHQVRSHQHIQCMACGTSYCDGACHLKPNAAGGAGGEVQS